MINRHRILLLVLILISALSCKKVIDDIDNAKVDFVTEFGFKIAEISIAINDTLNIDVKETTGNMPKPVIELFPGEDGILKLHISQKFNPIKLDSVLNYIDSVFTHPIPFPNISEFYSEGEIKFGFGLGLFSKNKMLEGKKIDSLKLDQGKLILEFNTYKHFNSNFEFRFPGITNEKKEILTIDNFSPGILNNKIEIDLSEHKIEVLRRNQNEYFLVELNYFIESLNADNNVNPEILLTLKDLDLEYAYGNFGTDTIEMQDLQEIPLFEKNLLNSPELKIDFEKPQIEVQAKNSFGVPFRFDIHQVKMLFNDGENSVVTGIPKSVLIDAPTIGNQNSYVSSLLTIDPSTNFDVLLGKSPRLLIIDGDLLVNPLNPLTKNYIRDQDSLSAILNIDIPIQLKIAETTLTNTLEKALFSQLKDSIVSAELIKIKADISNSFPFELYLQSYFTDGNKEVIDSLFSQPQMIKGAGKGGDPVTSIFYVDKNRSQINELFNTKNTITVANIKTTNAEDELVVSFRNENKLQIKLTVFTQLNVHN